jgi:SAM-dependent methyltransferase
MSEGKLFSYLKHQSFQPGFLSLFINPFFFIRRALYRNISHYAGRLSGKLLDFGCGRKPYEDLFAVTKYIGIDIEHSGHDHRLSKVDVYFDGQTIPFPDNEFDSLFCSEVLEHVFDPDEVLPEINRVLKKGATALITVPFCWNEHEVPFDYARYSSFGITHLLEKHGFRILELKKSGTFARVNFQLWALYFFELFKKWGRTGYLFSLVFIVPINLLGSIFLLLLPSNQTLYFNNIIVAEKVSLPQSTWSEKKQ